MIYKYLQYNKGYTLLFAVLVSSLVLSVGISILNVSKKEFLLASSARESTSAFYAADTGLECAAYFDSLGAFFKQDSTYTTTVSCGGYSPQQHNITLLYAFDDPYRVYAFDLNINGKSCAHITVKKDPITFKTYIESRGYNVGWSDSVKCDVASPRRVERALRYNY